jgi:hypothetical protein
MQQFSVKHCAFSLVFAMLATTSVYGMKRPKTPNIEDVLLGMVRDIDRMSSGLAFESMVISASFDQKIVNDINGVAADLAILNKKIRAAASSFPNYYEAALNIDMYAKIAELVLSVERYLFTYTTSLVKKIEEYSTGYKRLMYTEGEKNSLLAMVEDAADFTHQQKDKLKKIAQRIYTAGQQRQQEEVVVYQQQFEFCAGQLANLHQLYAEEMIENEKARLLASRKMFFLE